MISDKRPYKSIKEPVHCKDILNKAVLSQVESYESFNQSGINLQKRKRSIRAASIQLKHEA